MTKTCVTCNASLAGLRDHNGLRRTCGPVCKRKAMRLAQAARNKLGRQLARLLPPTAATGVCLSCNGALAPGQLKYCSPKCCNLMRDERISEALRRHRVHPVVTCGQCSKRWTWEGVYGAQPRFCVPCYHARYKAARKRSAARKRAA